MKTDYRNSAVLFFFFFANVTKIFILTSDNQAKGSHAKKCRAPTEINRRQLHIFGTISDPGRELSIVQLYLLATVRGLKYFTCKSHKYSPY